MTISGAIDSGVNGLIAYSNQVASISENLANTSTPGFKRVDTIFKDMVNGGEKTFSEPKSVVSIYSPDTVRSMPIYRVNVAGAVTTNSNPTSFAVTQGDGFIPVTETQFSSGKETLGTDARYTRAGDFSVDANNYLVNSQGQALMAVPESQPFISMAPPTVPPTPVFPSVPVAGDVLPVNLNPSVYSSMKGAPTTNMSVNVNFPGSVQETALPPWSVTTGGNTVTGGTGLAAGSDPNDQTLSAQFYDSNGSAHTLTLTLRKEYAADDGNVANTKNANTWAVIGMTATNDASASGAVVDLMPQNLGTTQPPYPTVSFDANGRLLGTTTIKVAIGPTSVDQNGNSLTSTLPTGKTAAAAASTIAMNFGAPSMNSTQFTGTALEIRGVTDTDGHAPGAFQSASITSDGYVQFSYSNSKTVTPYRLALASFNNPNLLTRITGSTFGANPGLAGAPSYSWSGASGGSGTVEPDAVEGSNVDVPTELTQMIQAQQAYGSNSKVVTVGDQMLQTLIALKS